MTTTVCTKMVRDMLLADVLVELYADGDTAGVSMPIATDTTDAMGAYLFDQLIEGEYFVHIPASEFAMGEPLEDKQSSAGNGGDDTTDDNMDENGVDGDQTTDGISSPVIDLYPNEEPSGEMGEGTYPGILDDDNVNMTVDFSFEYERVAIGNIVFMDNNENGSYEPGTDMAIENVVVQLYPMDSVIGVHAPLLEDTTDAQGAYLFDQLFEGSYVVHIPASEFGVGAVLDFKRTVDPEGGDDSNDDDADENGQNDLVEGGVSSTVIVLFPNDEPTGESGDGTYGGMLDDDKCEHDC